MYCFSLGQRIASLPWDELLAWLLRFLFFLLWSQLVVFVIPYAALLRLRRCLSFLTRNLRSMRLLECPSMQTQRSSAYLLFRLTIESTFHQSSPEILSWETRMNSMRAGSARMVTSLRGLNTFRKSSWKNLEGSGTYKTLSFTETVFSHEYFPGTRKFWNEDRKAGIMSRLATLMFFGLTGQRRGHKKAVYRTVFLHR